MPTVNCIPARKDIRHMPPTRTQLALASARSTSTPTILRGLMKPNVIMRRAGATHDFSTQLLDLGLLDFPALRDGRPIYLCWKAGEPQIAHWHGTDETFVDRKPLDP